VHEGVHAEQEEIVRRYEAVSQRVWAKNRRR